MEREKMVFSMNSALSKKTKKDVIKNKKYVSISRGIQKMT